MSWQTRVYLSLRGRGWCPLGALFEAIEDEIPLHIAMRAAMLPSRGRTELPTIPEARWRKFLSVLSAIGVETSGNPHCFKWQDEVRLRYVKGRVCEDCGGPVIKAGWAAVRGSAIRIACLACEAAAAAPQPVEEVPQVQDPVMAPPRSPQHAELIEDAARYAFLHRLVEQWGPPIIQRPAWHTGKQPAAGARDPPVNLVWAWPAPISRRKRNGRSPARSARPANEVGS